MVVLLIAGIIYPQVALAAWWNPFSWFDNWNFIRVGREKEALEERVKELEERLDESKSAASSEEIIEEKQPNVSTLKPAPAPASKSVSTQTKNTKSTVTTTASSIQASPVASGTISTTSTESSATTNYKVNIMEVDRNFCLAITQSGYYKTYGIAGSTQDTEGPSIRVALLDIISDANNVGIKIKGNVHIETLHTDKPAYLTISPSGPLDLKTLKPGTNLFDVDLSFTSANEITIDIKQITGEIKAYLTIDSIEIDGVKVNGFPHIFPASYISQCQ